MARTVTFKNRAAGLLIDGTGRASGGSAIGQDAHRLPWRPPADGRQGEALAEVEQPPGVLEVACGGH
jgi:hypothetical protein